MLLAWIVALPFVMANVCDGLIMMVTGAIMAAVAPPP